jgi:hypothetical protein
VRVEETRLESVSTQAMPGVVVGHTWQKHLLTFLMVFGPGLIVMEADNDAGAVSTYMQAGGRAVWPASALVARCAVAHLLLRSGDGGAARHCHR